MVRIIKCKGYKISILLGLNNTNDNNFKEMLMFNFRIEILFKIKLEFLLKKDKILNNNTIYELILSKNI